MANYNDSNPNRRGQNSPTSNGYSNQNQYMQNQRSGYGNATSNQNRYPNNYSTSTSNYGKNAQQPSTSRTNAAPTSYGSQGRQYQSQRNSSTPTKSGQTYSRTNSYYPTKGGGIAKVSNQKKMTIIIATSLAIILALGVILGGIFLFGPKQPDTPSNLVWTKTNDLNWKQSKNADKYTIRLDGNSNIDNKYYHTKTNQQNLNELELNRTYALDVKAENKKKESSYSEVKFIKRKALENAITLGTPQHLSIDTDTKLLSWESVPNASFYNIVINNNPYRVEKETTVYDLSNLSYGTHSISVIAKGDGQTYDDSAAAQIEYDNKNPNAVRLQAPQNLQINGNQLSWNPTSNAEFYTIYDNGNRINSYDSTVFVLSGLEVGFHTLQVKARTRNENFLDSDLSDPIYYEAQTPPSNKEKLPTPTITVDETQKTVSWGRIENAVGYKVNIDGQDNQTGTSTTYSLSNLSSGTHAIKVKALGEGDYQDSDYSATKQITIDNGTVALPAPQLQQNQKGEFIFWDPIKGASGYTIDISGELHSVNSDKAAFMVNFLSVGTYNIRVKARGNAQNGDSDWSNTIEYKAIDNTLPPPVLEKLATPKKPTIEGSQAKWEAVNNANGYMFKIQKVGGSTQEIPHNSLQYDLINFVNGVYNIQIKALGDNETQYSDSDYSEPAVYEKWNENATKLKTPSGLQVKEVSGIMHLIWDGTNKNPADGGWNVEIDGVVTHLWNNDISLDGIGTGIWKLRVQGLPQDTQTAYLPSDWAELEWDNQNEKLQTPQASLDISNRSISWLPIEGAKQYEIDINGVPYYTATSFDTSPPTTFDLRGLTQIQVYNIKVKARDKQKDAWDTRPLYSSSDWSNQLIYAPSTVLTETPIGYLAENKLNWYLVDNATSFEIDIEGEIIRVSPTTTELDLSQMTESRTYTLRIKALGDGGQYLESQWSADINYLVTNAPPMWETDKTVIGPDQAVANFEKHFPKQDYDKIFAHRLGTRAWKDDAEAQQYYQDDFDRESRTDFYSYDNLVKAIRTLATRQLEVYDRKGMIYWGSSRETVIDKVTGTRVVIKQGNPEIDAEWNQDKEPITNIIDFGDFMNSDNDNDNARELAAFLANISHETNGGYRGVNTPPDRYTYGLFWNEELDFINKRSSYYQNDDKTYEAVPGHSYHGRGPIQITWNYNYGAFSNIVFLDKNVLLNKPELVSQDGSLGFMAGLWFWMMPQYPKASCHDIIMGNYWPDRPEDMQYIYEGTTKHFALTIVVINGGFEGGKGPGESSSVEDRVGYFQTYAKSFGADISKDKLYTDGFSPWG